MLLSKIEELTLHLIKQDKKMVKQDEKMAEMEKEIHRLQKGTK